VTKLAFATEIIYEMHMQRTIKAKAERESERIEKEKAAQNA
jgi:hypothetical protein